MLTAVAGSSKQDPFDTPTPQKLSSSGRTIGGGRGEIYSRILVTLDGSEAAEPALLHARDLAHEHGSTLYLLQVISHNMGTNTMQGVRGIQQLQDYNVDIAHGNIEQRIAAAGKYLEEQQQHLESEGIQTITAVLEGGASQQILEYSKDNEIDLIVMTTHGRGGVRRVLVGSITDLVIKSSLVPVLVVPSQPE